MRSLSAVFQIRPVKFIYFSNGNLDRQLSFEVRWVCFKNGLWHFKKNCQTYLIFRLKWNHFKKILVCFVWNCCVIILCCSRQKSYQKRRGLADDLVTYLVWSIVIQSIFSHNLKTFFITQNILRLNLSNRNYLFNIFCLWAIL
jgi:hypothetical protein